MTKKHGFTLVELLIVIAIIGILIAMLLPAVNGVRAAARRMQCLNHLKQIGLALHSYHEAKSKFPPGATYLDASGANEGLGMFAFILPYIEQDALHDQLDLSKGADDEPNLTAGKSIPPIYECPSNPSDILDPFDTANEWPVIHYTGVMGPGKNGNVQSLSGNCGDYFTDGLFYPNSDRKAGNIRDGLSHTLAVGEHPNTSLRSWLKGAYYTGSPTTNMCVFSTKNLAYPLTNIDDQTDWTTLGVSFNDMPFGSKHYGGAHFLLADGSVHFFETSMEYQTLEGLADISGGEVTEWLP